MVTNANRLARLQQQFGVNTLGVYLGVYTDPWRVSDFQRNIIQPWLALGSNRPNYAYVKVGEWATEWYDGTFPTIRKAFLDEGFGCCPFYFCRPDTWEADAEICARLAREAGVFCLDIEEQWEQHGDTLLAFTSKVRELAGPEPVLLVSGYGDPLTAVPQWNFKALEPCDGYQPQWYIGWWDVYHARGWQTAIAWGDGQCYQAFTKTGLGADYPIQPALNVEGVALDDLRAASQYLLRAFKCSSTYWVQSDMTSAHYTTIATARANLTGTQPPPQPKTYTVQPGDTLSSIAAKEHVAGGWPVLYQDNRSAIGTNPNLIRAGMVLYLP